MSLKRAAIAGVFAVVYPGLGHLYLRAWIRALAWIAIAILTAVVVMPASLVEAFEAGGIAAFIEASRELPLRTVLPIVAVRVMNVVDAVWTALLPTDAADDGGTDGPGAGTCPNCGGELDGDINFCPWCTFELDDADAGEATSSR